LTWLRRSSRGFDEPCGEWQVTHPSVFTGACSKAKGPALSVWQLKQIASWAAVARSWCVMNPP
jgi:hypothetical protein